MNNSVNGSVDKQQTIVGLPEGSYLQQTNGHTYVMYREFFYDTETKKSSEKRQYLGQVVDGVFYSQEEYRRNFARGMIRRKAPLEPQLADIAAERVQDPKWIEALSTTQIEFLFNSVNSGIAGPVPILWRTAVSSGLYDDLFKTFGNQEIANKALSLAMFYVIYGDNSSNQYAAFANKFHLPFKRELTSQEISAFYRELGSNDMFTNYFFIARSKRLMKEGTIVSIDSTTINSTASRYSLTQVSKSKTGNYASQINFVLIMNSTTHEPITFRTVPGNVNDCCTLVEIVSHLKGLDVIHNCVTALDRAYCNINNIGLAQDNGLKCCMALSLHSKWSLEAVDQALPFLDKNESILQDGENHGYTINKSQPDNNNVTREFCVHVFKNQQNEFLEKSRFFKKIEAFKQKWLAKNGNVKALLNKPEMQFLTYDPDDLSKPLEANQQAIDEKLKYAGCFAAVTTYACSAQECFSTYDMRDDIERVFRSGKQDINLNVLRTHSDQTSKGKFLISFIAMILLERMKYELSKKKTKTLKNGKVVVDIPANSYTIKDVLNITKSVCFHRRPISNEVFYLAATTKQNAVAKAVGCEGVYLLKSEY